MFNFEKVLGNFATTEQGDQFCNLEMCGNFDALQRVGHFRHIGKDQEIPQIGNADLLNSGFAYVHI